MSIPFSEEPVTYSLREKGGVVPSRGVHLSEDAVLQVKHG